MTPAAASRQRNAALKHANHVRFVRVRHKREVGAVASLSGTRRAIAERIERPQDELLNMTVMELLCAGWHHGPTLSKRFLRGAGISEAATIGALTDRQQGALVSTLRGLNG